MWFCQRDRFWSGHKGELLCSCSVQCCSYCHISSEPQHHSQCRASSARCWGVNLACTQTSLYCKHPTHEAEILESCKMLLHPVFEKAKRFYSTLQWVWTEFYQRYNPLTCFLHVTVPCWLGLVNVTVKFFCTSGTIRLTFYIYILQSKLSSQKNSKQLYKLHL